MTISDLEAGAPSVAAGTVRHYATNAQKRLREYLKADEVAAMVRATSQHGRYGARDAALILTMYRHGLRASEACALTWGHIDFKNRILSVPRAKGGIPGVHPLRKPEAKALRAIVPDCVDLGRSGGRQIFTSERGSMLGPKAVHKIVARAGRLAKLPFTVHPHMLRHGCGYAMADAGDDVLKIQWYLGHRNIASTMIYVAQSPRAFANSWLD